jgi:hypothetical protein
VARVAVAIVVVWCAACSVVLAFQTQTGTPLPAIAVSAPADVAVVEGLSDALTALSRTVTSCVDAGRKLETCQCSDPQNLARLRKDFDTALTAHADRRDRIVSYQYVGKDGRNMSGTIVFSNLRRQLETLKCE